LHTLLLCSRASRATPSPRWPPPKRGVPCALVVLFLFGYDIFSFWMFQGIQTGPRLWERRASTP
jgi:hypothetical protein